MSSSRSRSGGTRSAHHGEAVEQVGAEAPLVDLARQVAVGRGDDAHVDRVAARWSPSGVTLRALEHAEELGLQRAAAARRSRRGTRVPPLGHLEQALALGVGAGEGALGVAEQLGLHELAEQRAAVDDDERRRPCARDSLWIALGDLLLAGAGIALDAAPSSRSWRRRRAARTARASPPSGRAPSRSWCASRPAPPLRRRPAPRAASWCRGERDRLDDGDLADLHAAHEGAVRRRQIGDAVAVGNDGDLEMVLGDRVVAEDEVVRFVRADAIDGLIHLRALADVGAAQELDGAGLDEADFSAAFGDDAKEVR